MNIHYDVIIIGGGPAGLTAALTLARGGRSVYVIDKGKGRNAPASHMMNFPSQDGTPPSKFRELIREDLIKYSKVQIEMGKVTSLTRIENGFEVNKSITSKKILLAHGVRDILPAIPGMKELWGKTIFHCPYCHGYEHMDSPIGFISEAEFAPHYGALLKGLTTDLIYFSNGNTVSDSGPYTQNGIKVYSQKIIRLIHDNEKLKGLELESGEIVKREFLFYKPKQELSSTLGIDLGCELNQFNLYQTDDFGMTTQPGIYAAGDIVHPRQSVLNACASASNTAAGINYAIMQEKFIKI